VISFLYLTTKVTARVALDGVEEQKGSKSYSSLSIYKGRAGLSIFLHASGYCCVSAAEPHVSKTADVQSMDRIDNAVYHVNASRHQAMYVTCARSVDRHVKSPVEKLALVPGLYNRD
jgi:hypothetical protein